MKTITPHAANIAILELMKMHLERLNIVTIPNLTEQVRDELEKARQKQLGIVQGNLRYVLDREAK